MPSISIPEQKRLVEKKLVEKKLADLRANKPTVTNPPTTQPSNPVTPAPAPKVTPTAPVTTPVTTPATITTPTQPTQGTTPTQDMADKINEEAKTVYNGLKTTDEDGKPLTPNQIIANWLQSQESPEAPKSMATLFNEEKAKLGLEPLETELNTIDRQINEINTALLVQSERAGEMPVSMAEIGRKRSALQIEAEQRKAYLNVQRNAVAQQIQTKYNTLETIMQYTNQDYQNASAYYNQKFNQAMSLYNMFSKEEEKQDKIRSNAVANLTTLQNIYKENNVKYNDLTTTQKVQIRLLELQSGLPVNTFKTFMDNKPKSDILTTVKGTDASGNDIVSIIYKNADGTPGTVKIVKTGGYSKVSTGTSSSDTEEKEEKKIVENFRNDVADLTRKLSEKDPTGKPIYDWAYAWDYMKAKYGQYFSNEEIDQALGGGYNEATGEYWGKARR